MHAGSLVVLSIGGLPHIVRLLHDRRGIGGWRKVNKVNFRGDFEAEREKRKRPLRSNIAARSRVLTSIGVNSKQSGYRSHEKMTPTSGH